MSEHKFLIDPKVDLVHFSSLIRELLVSVKFNNTTEYTISTPDSHTYARLHRLSPDQYKAAK